MTWSIIAQDGATGRVGIAVASRFFAVGSRVSYIRTGAGAVATQAFVNQSFGRRGLDLLEKGAAAEETLRQLIASDEGRDHRQLHLMDNARQFAAYTGSACIDWCGHIVGDSFSVAGNMLTGPDVIHATVEAYRASSHLPFARRLIAALQAGETAGGDKRGKQSAALLVHDGDEFPIYDLRADDHSEPIPELTRLHAVALERFVHFRRFTLENQTPSGVPDRTVMEDFIAASIDEGYE